MTYAASSAEHRKSGSGWIVLKCDSDRKARRPKSLILSILERKKGECNGKKTSKHCDGGPLGSLDLGESKPEDFASTKDGHVDASMSRRRGVL